MMPVFSVWVSSSEKTQVPFQNFRCVTDFCCQIHIQATSVSGVYTEMLITINSYRFGCQTSLTTECCS